MSLAGAKVFILTSAPLEQIGGTEQSTRETVRVLERRGYSVHVFHCENSGAPQWLKRFRPLRRLLWDLCINIAIARAASRAAQEGLVAILSNGPIGCFPVRTRGGSVKRFHYYRGTYYELAHAIRPFISWRGYMKLRWWDSMVLEKLAGQGKVCLANSNQTRDEVRRLFGHDSITIWNPVDVERFRPLDQEECRSRLRLPMNNRIGIFVGSTHPQKGFVIVEQLIRAFPDICWLLALRGATVSTGVGGSPRVRVFANVDQDQLPWLYGAADFALFPSRYEPFGRVVAEAMACGIPTIASTGGASRVLLSQPPLERFLIADPADVPAFGTAVREVLADPAGYRRVVLQSVRPTVEELFSLDRWGERFLEVTGL